MNILKESKEKLPLVFLTKFISDGWEKIGILQDEIKDIKETFSNTKEIEELIQALIDAYLVCIGQLEQHLTNKKYIELSSLNKELTLKENANINIDNINVIDANKIKAKKEGQLDTNIHADVNELLINTKTNEKVFASEIEPKEIINLEKLQAIEEECKEKTIDKHENFEYFTDFPAPAKETQSNELNSKIKAF